MDKIERQIIKEKIEEAKLLIEERNKQNPDFTIDSSDYIILANALNNEISNHKRILKQYEELNKK